MTSTAKIITLHKTTTKDDDGVEFSSFSQKKNQKKCWGTELIGQD